MMFLNGNLMLMRKFTRLMLLAAGLVLVTAAVRAEPIDFTLPTTDGNTLSLSDYRGKWVIVNYWATWCPPCLEEIPDLMTFHERFQDTEAVVLGVNHEDIPLEQLKVFMDDYFVSYPVVRTNGIDPAHERLPIGGLPTTYIISPEGEPVARQVGTITSDAIEAFINRKKAARQQAASVVEKKCTGTC